MLPPTLALLTLAVVSLSSATPIRSPSAKTFSVKQSVPKPFVPGSVQLAKVLLKYGLEDVSKQIFAAAKRSGTTSATPETYDEEYLCPISIGGQTVDLDFDTGSADLWVFSSQQPVSQTNGHSIYTLSNSSSAQLMSGYTWGITYQSGGSASGNVYTDTVNIGGATVTGQAVELATTASSAYIYDTACDGMLGLGFSSINSVKPQAQQTFFGNAMSQGALQSNVFTANLQKGAPGTYDFGFIDSSKYTGSITYVPVNSGNGFWGINPTGYAIGSGSLVASSINAVADTGTTFLLLDASIVSAYYAQVTGAVSGSSGWTFPCSSVLPSFTLRFGAYNAVIPGSYMNYCPSVGYSCYGGLQSNAGIGFSILGDIFLKSQFVVFDGGNSQLGLAAKPLAGVTSVSGATSTSGASSSPITQSSASATSSASSKGTTTPTTSTGSTGAASKATTTSSTSTASKASTTSTSPKKSTTTKKARKTA